MSTSERSEICRFFAFGGCTRGDDCPYSHHLTIEASSKVEAHRGFVLVGQVKNAAKQAAVDPLHDAPPALDWVTAAMDEISPDRADAAPPTQHPPPSTSWYHQPSAATAAGGPYDAAAPLDPRVAEWNPSSAASYGGGMYEMMSGGGYDAGGYAYESASPPAPQTPMIFDGSLHSRFAAPPFGAAAVGVADADDAAILAERQKQAMRPPLTLGTAWPAAEPSPLFGIAPKLSAGALPFYPGAAHGGSRAVAAVHCNSIVHPAASRLAAAAAPPLFWNKHEGGSFATGVSPAAAMHASAPMGYAAALQAAGLGHMRGGYSLMGR